MTRAQAKNSATEKRQSGVTDDGSPAADGDQKEGSISSSNNGGSAPRKLYFNLPLPPELKDEEGHPIQQFPRNKIRTAKYTPLSFIPKNLWFQFHNIANIFFLFLVILVVRASSPPFPSFELSRLTFLNHRFSLSLAELILDSTPSP